ncbi:MFS transporter [Nocardioides sp. BP30]|uniref:MFS transporter n=1 Tax=Nocardioides sp. BP30 TaxID=3036374 RepID=UPI002468970B|nr:MFS transporter [Nocardioides sp. BP30]WGL51158.1 MFS transporter [Nocardioides sp. BP30]
MTTMSREAEIASHTSPGRARLELLIIGTAALAVSLCQSLLIPILGILPQQIPSHPSSAAVEWLLTSTLLVGAVAVPLFGRLGDMFGKRLMLMVAVLALVVGSVLCGVTSAMPLLILGRAIQGASMAAIPLGISLLASLLPREKVGRAIALISAMLGVGGALALPIGGFVGEHADFHWLFWITAIVGGLSLGGILLVVPEAPSRSRGRVDVVGAVLLSAALVALLLPLAQTSTWGWGSPKTIGLLVLAVVLLLVFGLVQTRTREPLVDLAALRRKPIVLTNTASVLFGFALFAMMIGTAQYVQAPKESGYGFASSILVSGVCMLPAGLMMLLLSNVSAAMIHRIGAPRTLAIGALVVALGWVLRIALTGHLWEIVVGTAVIGVGVALGYAAMPTLINTHTPVTELAAANGLNSLARSLGTSLASAIGGSVLAGHVVVATIDGTAVGWSTLGAYRALFAACIVASMIAAGLALLVPRHADTDAMPEL